MNREVVKQYNDVELNLEDEHGLYGIGYCNNTGSKFYFDMSDYDLIKEYCWLENIHKGYRSLQAWSIGSNGNIVMSNLLGCKYYDHEDRNPLNNRRYNLRPATYSQNTANRDVMKNNTSGITGVSWDKTINKWIVRLQVDHARIRIGNYIDKNDAIVARLLAEKQYFGEFAPQKHLFNEYGIL